MPPSLPLPPSAAIWPSGMKSTLSRGSLSVPWPGISATAACLNAAAAAAAFTSLGSTRNTCLPGTGNHSRGRLTCGSHFPLFVVVFVVKSPSCRVRGRHRGRREVVGSFDKITLSRPLVCGFSVSEFAVVGAISGRPKTPVPTVMLSLFSSCPPPN